MAKFTLILEDESSDTPGMSRVTATYHVEGGENNDKGEVNVNTPALHLGFSLYDHTRAFMEDLAAASEGGAFETTEAAS